MNGFDGTGLKGSKLTADQNFRPEAGKVVLIQRGLNPANPSGKWNTVNNVIHGLFDTTLAEL